MIYCRLNHCAVLTLLSFQQQAETDHDLKVQQGKATSAPPIPLVEMRHCLRNTEKVVDNNMELFEAQRVEDIKVWHHSTIYAPTL
jgi:hypothetical protein